MTQGKQRSFTTSFGRTTHLLEGYYELHESVRAKDTLAWLKHSQSGETPETCEPSSNLFKRAHEVLAQEGLAEFSKRVFQRMTGFEVPPGSYLKDVFLYSLMLDFLMRRGIECRWETALDIGGAEGFVSRLLKAEGIVKKAACVDIIDIQQRSSRIQEFQRNFRINLKLGNSKALLGWQPTTYGFSPPPGHKFWNIKFNHNPELDDYIFGDFLNMQGSFDFISGLAVIPYFELEELFAKLSALLRPGGIFFCLVDYWWWPVNSTMVCGRFPYASQRLTAEDFELYVREFHASEAEDILMRYNYYHKGKQRPTVSDYLDYGWRAGFEPIGYERLMPSEKPHPKTPMPPKALEQCKEFSFEEVLEDIHCLRPDVKLVDLQTAFVMFAMTKRDRATKSFCFTKS